MPIKDKTLNACETCRAKKVKCSGTFPCTYCQHRGLDCRLTRKARKKLYSIRYVEDLQSRLEKYEKTEGPLASNPSESTSYVQDDQSIPDHPVDPEGDLTPVGQRNDVSPDRTRSMRGSTRASPRSNPSVRTSNRHPQPSVESTITAETYMNSSHITGAQVGDLLWKRTPVSDHVQSRSSTAWPLSSAGNPINGFSNTQQPSFEIPGLPNREEAFDLMSAVNLFIGQTHQHFDIREISDHLGLFFDNGLSSISTPKIWYLKLVLIFAIGKLYKGRFDDEVLPGDRYFKCAQASLPSLSELYAAKRHGVELLSLMALYLQNTQRREESYLYVNSALRIAISHGFHRHDRVKEYLQSERSHLNRLWWTIYMQEKRLAAATGAPSSVPRDIVELDMPGDTFGFPSPFPLCLNIRIGHITGRILDTLYGRNPKIDGNLIHNVQSIIQELHDIAADLPVNFSEGTGSLTPTGSIRTFTSIHILLYQAILLTIRPIMLHVARLILTGDESSRSTIYSSSLGRLSRTCAEAASRLLQMTLMLKRQNLIAIFGFFDLDATFSGAFIMILTAIFNTICEEDQVLTPSPGLSEAIEVLRYLSDRGNIFAEEKLKEVEHIWSQLHIDNHLNNGPLTRSNWMGVFPGAQDHTHTTPRPSENRSSWNTPNRSTDPQNQTSAIGHKGALSMIDSQPIPDTPLLNAASMRNEDFYDLTFGDWLAEDANLQYNELLQDQDWLLTGQDSIDFAELASYLPGFGE